MGKPVEADEAALATQGVTSLHEQADALRVEIARLRQELAEVQSPPLIVQAAELIEANSQLVLSALQAEEAAETAAGELDRLTETSQRDVLTGTPNRAVLRDRLESAITLARRHGSRVAVLFLDLDRFKKINDSLGHAAGDDVLRLVAERLGSTLRDSDTISRHGGDEFLVLLSEVGDANDAALAATKLLLSIAEPCLVGGEMLHLSASIGISIYPEDGADAPNLIACADAAMYQSKRRGRGGFAFHNKELPSGCELQQPDIDQPGSDELQERVQALRKVNQERVISARTTRDMRAAATEERQEQIDFLTAMIQEMHAHHAGICAGAEPVRASGDAALLVRLQETLERQVARLTH